MNKNYLVNARPRKYTLEMSAQKVLLDFLDNLSSEEKQKTKVELLINGKSSKAGVDLNQ